MVTQNHPFDIHLIEKQALKYIKLETILKSSIVRFFKVILLACCFTQFKQCQATNDQTDYGMSHVTEMADKLGTNMKYSQYYAENMNEILNNHYIDIPGRHKFNILKFKQPKKQLQPDLASPVKRKRFLDKLSLEQRILYLNKVKQKEPSKSDMSL